MVRRERTSIKVGTERVRRRQGPREGQAGRVALRAGLFPLPPFGSPVLEPDLEAKREKGEGGTRRLVRVALPAPPSQPASAPFREGGGPARPAAEKSASEHVQSDLGGRAPGVVGIGALLSQSPSQEARGGFDPRACLGLAIHCEEERGGLERLRFGQDAAVHSACQALSPPDQQDTQRARAEGVAILDWQRRLALEWSASRLHHSGGFLAVGFRGTSMPPSRGREPSTELCASERAFTKRGFFFPFEGGITYSIFL